MRLWYGPRRRHAVEDIPEHIADRITDTLPHGLALIVRNALREPQQSLVLRSMIEVKLLQEGLKQIDSRTTTGGGWSRRSGLHVLLCSAVAAATAGLGCFLLGSGCR